MAIKLDILFLADVRFEGGTSTALAVEMKAAALSGLHSGLLAVKAPLLGLPFPMHPDLRALADQGLIERIDPEVRCEADLVIIHHPAVMANMPSRPLLIDTRKVILVIHHPLFDRSGAQQFDLDAVVRNCNAAFGREVVLAAVSPVVRNSLKLRLPAKCVLLDEDWTNLIDLDEWPIGPCRAVRNPMVIGRHARPDALKWPSPEDVFHIYPTDEKKYHIRALGAGPFLHELYGPIPANWELIPFEYVGVAEFLTSLDFYVYFHDDRWSEAFGRAILEALAVGLVVVLPQHFETLFGDAAVYALPEQVEQVLETFASDAALFGAQRAKARKFVESFHSSMLYKERILRLRASASPSRVTDGPGLSLPPLPVCNVLFASSNGIGVGHLVQQLAIAQRLPMDLRSIFATMSYSMKAVSQEGYQAHFLAHHRALGAEPDDWNNVLAEELFDLMKHIRPRVFAYDSTAVFEGVARAISMFPNTFSIWVRRPMWRESHRPFLEFSRRFDAIIEPGELAEDFDQGPTTALRHEVLRVPPVLHIDPSQRMGRSAARAALDIPDDATVIAVELGSGANFDMSEVRRIIIQEIRRRPNTFVLEIKSPLATLPQAAVAPEDGHRTIELFPSYRYSRAFDAAVSAAGYNAFHEHILGAIPTLFVPNEADEMDLQIKRAQWAELAGRGWLLRRDFDLGHVATYVDRLLDPAERARVVQRCENIDWTNGAVAIASYIEDHARLVRTDWDQTRSPE